MSTHEQITNNPTSAVRNTGGRNGPQGLEEHMSDEVLREMCDKNYHQLLPLIAEKMQKEKEQKDKLNAVKARLIYGEESGVKIRSHEESHYSESKTPTARTEPRRRHGGRYSRSPSPHASVFKRLKKYRSPSPRLRPRKEGGVFNRLGRKEPATSARPDSRQRSPQAKRTEVEARRRQQKGTPSRTTSQYSESEDSEGGHWKSKSRRQRSNTYEDDLSQPWTCEERNPFTPRIRHFSLPRTRMPSHVKTYDGSGDPEDHLKLFQSAAKTEGWAMPTWCHMFNSTLTGNARVWFDKLPKESIDSYEDLRTAFRENYLQQTKHIKDPVEIHHIKQRDGESTKDFMERIQGRSPGREVVALRSHSRSSSGRKASFIISETSQGCWGDKPNFKKGFKNKQRPDRKPDRFSLLTKTPKEIFALEKGKFKAPPPMNDKPKALKKGEASGKDKPLTILMIQPWERVAKPRITQSFFPETAMSFPPLKEEDGTKGPMIIEVEMGGHFVHRVYIDGGASSEVLYEHCFIKLRKEIKDQMVPAITHLVGFSGETIWPLGQIALLVKIGDEIHSTSAWMNFMGYSHSQLKQEKQDRHRKEIRPQRDVYPLPEIAGKVESLTCMGIPSNAFSLDAYARDIVGLQKFRVSHINAYRDKAYPRSHSRDILCRRPEQTRRRSADDSLELNHINENLRPHPIYYLAKITSDTLEIRDTIGKSRYYMIGASSALWHCDEDLHKEHARLSRKTRKTDLSRD
ncbi:reverse transcriptase domain-containing protein [Tanacetum coccineum]